MRFLRTNRTLSRLEHMLEEALNGEYNEKHYDESRLSRLEVKWKRFLDAADCSAKKVEEEREGIKQMISDISHQTKTPLANILLYTQLLKERTGDEESLAMVERIEEQAGKLSFLMQSLVKTSRLENGVFVLSPEKQPLKPLLEAAFREIGKAAAEKEISLTLEAGGEKACYDRKWTEEALCNLLDNAVKYSPRNSNIRVHIQAYELFTAVVVEDEGIGIREEEQTRIFGRFYRGKDVAQEKGVGIGLYLAREIAWKQGGYITVSSQYGKGSAFSFYMKNDIK